MKYVHIEGVNFDLTIFDTSDISTVRGASRAYEDIVAAFAKAIPEADVITCGASKLTAKTDLRLADLKENLPDHLKTIAQVLSFVEGVADTVEKAITLAQISALRAWTAPTPIEGDEACSLSHRQAAEVTAGVKGGVSKFVKQRRDYGLAYRRSLKDATYRFSLDFEELVHSEKELPISAQAKLAVVYVDGAGFGAALDSLLKLAGKESVARDRARKTYSKAASALQSNIIEKSMLWARQASDDERLQLEVLLAGGDDMIFVMPCWKLMDFLVEFGNWTHDAKLADHPVWFRAGCVIAHHKTPIRQMLDLAGAAVDEIRTAGVMPALGEIGVYSIDILESAAPPPDGLGSHRKRRFGGSLAVTSFCWPLGGIQGLKSTIEDARRNERDAGGKRLQNLPPRSKLFQILAGIEDLSSDTAAETVKRRFASYASAVQGMAEEQSSAVLSNAFRLDEFGVSAPLALRLAFVTELWDYTGDLAV